MNAELGRARLLRAALGLDGPVELDDGAWAEWTALALRERVVPQLFAASFEQGELLEEERRAHALEMQLDVNGMMLRLEHQLLHAARALDGSEIAFAVLKGAATAHLDHVEPSRRQFGDVDLLVAPDTFVEARQLLEENGWRHAYPLPRHHERFTHAVTFRGPAGVEIDLHQHIAHRALGLLIPTEDLLAARAPFEVAVRPLWALGDTDRVIHACVHAVASRGVYRRLSSVVDVLVLSERREDRAPEVLARADRWRVRPLVELAIREAYSAAMLAVPEPWTRAMASPVRRRDRILERAYTGAHRRPALEEAAHLRHLPRWRDRVLYLYGHLRMETGRGSGGLLPRLRYLSSRLRQRA